MRPPEAGPKLPRFLQHTGGAIAFSALLCRAERCTERGQPPSSRRAAATGPADRLPDRLLDAAAARMRPALCKGATHGATASCGAVAAHGGCRAEARALAAAGDSAAVERASVPTSDSSCDHKYEVTGLGSAAPSVKLVPLASIKRGCLSAISSASDYSSSLGGDHALQSPGPYAKALSEDCSSHSVLIGRDGRTVSVCSGVITTSL